VQLKITAINIKSMLGSEAAFTLPSSMPRSASDEPVIHYHGHPDLRSDVGVAPEMRRPAHR